MKDEDAAADALSTQIGHKAPLRDRTIRFFTGEFSPMRDEEIYTIDELADRWKLTRKTVLKLIRDGQLQAFRVGKGWRIRADAVDAFERGTSGEETPQA
jgi:excisionase family DNA binding protein